MTDEPKIEAVKDAIETEAAAGIYLMVQFTDVDSTNFKIVVSQPPPSPLAVLSALQRVIDRTKVGMVFQQELELANQLQQAQQAMRQAMQIKCQNCQLPMEQKAVEKLMAGKVVFCPRCHQKVG